ncbi:MAG: sigma-54 dependent transcriptional regulator, partial [candidate division Zixibacteria bacterium]
KSQGFDVDTSESGEEALEKIKTTCFDIIISDYKMHEMTGYDLMKQAKQLHPSSAFIMMTGFGNIPLAVEMIREGAADFIPKPFEYVTILQRIESLLEHVESTGRSDDEEQWQMVVQSQKMKDIQDLALKAAASDIAVLIQGESGSGKRLFAKVVHSMSARSRHEFVTVECSNSSEAALEREIFGADDSGESGALHKANGGTLFLRDIDKLYPNLQLRMLRFISEGTYLPANTSNLRKSDLRIISATTDGFDRLIDNGTFRKDLYYQLSVMPIYVPPLRARISDLGPLVDHFIAKYNAKLNKNITGISSDAISWMESYNWPGNVQELENILSRACALATGGVLDESLIFTLPQDRPAGEEPVGYLNMTLKDNQKTLILKALNQNNNNYSRTASQLGISRTTLWRRMKKFKIEGIQIEK